MTVMKYITTDETGTLEVAHSFAGSLNPGVVVALIGALGTGKTVFARGVAQAFGVKERITSPTFTLIHEYQIQGSKFKVQGSKFKVQSLQKRGYIPLYHIDLYRMNSVREMQDIGMEDYLYSDGISLVEWAEKLGELFPEDAICVTIKHLGDDRREIEIEKRGKP